MQFIHLIAILQAALTITAAPTRPAQTGTDAASIEAVSQYMNAVADEAHTFKLSGSATKPKTTACNVGSVKMNSGALGQASAGLTLKFVEIGRGTQNYTCGKSSTEAPTQVGALASLSDAGCLASKGARALALAPRAALQFDAPSGSGDKDDVLMPMLLSFSGTHFFDNPTTPVFDLGSAGRATCSKAGSTPAPSSKDVAWLKLTAKKSTGGIKEIFRLNTAGGVPPATCKGKENSAFEVSYSAEYWFWGS